MQKFPFVISILHQLILVSSLSLIPTISRATQPDVSHFTAAAALPLIIFSFKYRLPGFSGNEILKHIDIEI